MQRMKPWLKLNGYLVLMKVCLSSAVCSQTFLVGPSRSDDMDLSDEHLKAQAAFDTLVEITDDAPRKSLGSSTCF